MEIKVKTSFNADLIIQETDMMHSDFAMVGTGRIFKQVMHLHDQGVRDALVKLGWIPPFEATPVTDGEDAHERYQAIDLAVRDLTDKMTADLDEEHDHDIRMRLTEVFRFWR